MTEVFIGLGSNLDEPLLQIKKALENLQQLESVSFIKSSDYYRSAPMGPQDQPDYINAVVKVTTELAAEDLLDVLQEVENKHGRVRSQHWGARTLDLDILLFGNEVINTERLTVPHYGISERNFVLYPLSDLAPPDFDIPGAGKLSELLNACPMNGIERLTEL